MTDKELLYAVLHDKETYEKALKGLSDEIEDELLKKDPDYDRIAYLSEVYCKITGVDETVKQRSEVHKQKIINEASKIKKTKKHDVRKTLTAVAASAAIVLSANAISTSAFGVNIFKAIVHKEEKGFFIEYTTEEKLADPYGIKSECAKYNIDPETPQYIPEGFEVLEINHEELDNEVMFDFLYHKDDMSIGVYYDVFDNPEDIKYIKYPSDEFNITEIKINGYPAVVSKEDGQMTLSYARDNILLSIFTVNVPYEECDKIVNSIG